MADIEEVEVQLATEARTYFGTDPHLSVLVQKSFAPRYHAFWGPKEYQK